MKKIFDYIKLACLAMIVLGSVTLCAGVKADSIYDKNPATGMPYWYPEDVNAFEDFNDYDAPRVVDVADIFTDEEEERILEGITRIQDDYGIDLVVFTDVSSYGLSRNVYAADFHQFNGYGFGDDFTGSILFICMEEGNRGWYTAATGSIEDIYKDMDTINYIDDRLEPYMLDGDYGEGVINYVDDIYELYRLPDWVYEKAYDIEEEPKPDPSAPRFVDMVGCFDSENADIYKKEFTEKIEEIRSKYNTDVVVLLDDGHIYNYSSYDYADLYYYYNGYGAGQDREGIMLYLKMDGGYMEDVAVYANGDRECFSYKNLERLRSHVYSKKIPISAIETFLKNTEKMYKKGKVPVHVSYFWLFIVSAVVGIIAGLVTICVLHEFMISVEDAVRADAYAVDGSYELTGKRDIFLYKTVTKVRRESSSSSGGRSSGGSFHSSGGRSYSGGGRSF